MPPSLSAVLQLSLIALTSIFFLVDPVAVVPSFLVITADAAEPRRRKMARRAAWTCFIVLSSFALAGSLIFKLFGITLPAFKIAGGIILILIGLDMLQARRSQTKETPDETMEGSEKEDAGIIPLGVPMLAGPGSISTVMVLMSGSEKWWEAIPIFASIALTCLASYWILAGADRVRSYLGETGIRILMRMMGLLLTAIAVQFILNGMADVGMIKR
jgi:multiple antibiotic resistance protein